MPDRVIVGDLLSGTGDLPSGLTLFRDRNGWCPYSERVWLAMLAKQLDFDEVLINLQVRISTSACRKAPCHPSLTLQHRRTQGSKPRWYAEVNPSSQTPCVRGTDGRVITESLRIIESLDSMFPDGPQLFPADAALKEEALKLMNSFSSVFPSGTRPSSRGSFLYKGQDTSKHVHACAPARDPTDAAFLITV